MVERDLPKVDVEGSRPFSRSKIKDQVEGLVFYFTSDISRTRTREEGSTKFGHARSAKSEFWNYRASDKPIRVSRQPHKRRLTTNQTLFPLESKDDTFMVSFLLLFVNKVKNPRRGFHPQ